VGLADKASALPANLSGGQKQRVAIARALAGDPSIILADEPTAALDSTSGQLVMDLLRSLASQHERAVVIVTHDSRTFRYADRIVAIEDGRLASTTEAVA
jgi:putative ABC transport system ATP-binding protein